MKTFIKLLFGSITLLILAVIALVVFINPNDYKEEIQLQVKENLNREFLINDDIYWSLYPTLGFSSGSITLKNRDEFNKNNFITIKAISVGIEILPILHGDIKISKVLLDGFELNITKNQQGISNIQDLVSGSNKKGIEKQNNTLEDQKTNNSKPTQPNWSIDELLITNTQIIIQDLSTDSFNRLEFKKIKLGKFELDKPTDLTILAEVKTNELSSIINIKSKLLINKSLTNFDLKDFILESKLSGKAIPQGKLTASVVSNVNFNLNDNILKISDILAKVNDLALTGFISAKDLNNINFTLIGNQWNLDPYLISNNESEKDLVSSSNPPSQSSNSLKASNSSKNTSQVSKNKEIEPDLSILKRLTLDGTLSIEGIKASNILVEKIKMDIQIDNGELKLAPLTAELYQGTLKVNAKLFHANGLNKFKFDEILENVQISPLLNDLAEINLLSGSVNSKFTAVGQGLTPYKIKSGLKGDGSFYITDGSLNGINIPQTIRSIEAAFKGKSIDEKIVKKTDFSSLKGDFNINKGIVNNHSLVLMSPLLQLNGEGTADIIKSILDYNLKVNLVKSLEGQKRSSTDLSSIEIPLKIQGRFNEPEFSLDMDEVFKAKIEAEKERAKKKVESKLKEKLGSALSDLFG